jgi:hypothetical protein
MCPCQVVRARRRPITVLILVLEAPAYLRVEGVRPALTVYYLGVPDTTPEFSSEAALDAYPAGTQPRGC